MDVAGCFYFSSLIEQAIPRSFISLFLALDKISEASRVI